MEPANTDDITVLGGHYVSCFGYVTADVRSPAVLGMQSVAHEVIARDVKPVGFVIIDMCFLQTDNVSFLLGCYAADEVALRGRQTLNIELHNAQRWTKRLKVLVRLVGVVVGM
jgi:hypothetical protein